jgi:hypothetical protein
VGLFWRVDIVIANAGIIESRHFLTFKSMMRGNWSRICLSAKSLMWIPREQWTVDCPHGRERKKPGTQIVSNKDCGQNQPSGLPHYLWRRILQLKMDGVGSSFWYYPHRDALVVASYVPSQHDPRSLALRMRQDKAHGHQTEWSCSIYYPYLHH